VYNWTDGWLDGWMAGWMDGWMVEKPEAFFERTCSDVRKKIQIEIGELLPVTHSVS